MRPSYADRALFNTLQRPLSLPTLAQLSAEKEAKQVSAALLQTPGPAGALHPITGLVSDDTETRIPVSRLRLWIPNTMPEPSQKQTPLIFRCP